MGLLFGGERGRRHLLVVPDTVRLIAVLGFRIHTWIYATITSIYAATFTMNTLTGALHNNF